MELILLTVIIWIVLEKLRKQKKDDKRHTGEEEGG
jgi:hypothetical protein